MITLFQGGAGTGKSFTLRAVCDALRSAGHTVIVAAPQHQQANDLRKDGVGEAVTLAHLLSGYPIKAISRAKGIDNRKGTAGTYKEMIITDR